MLSDRDSAGDNMDTGRNNKAAENDRPPFYCLQPFTAHSNAPFLYSVILFDRRRFVYLVQKAGGPKKIVDKENRVIHSPKG